MARSAARGRAFARVLALSIFASPIALAASALAQNIAVQTQAAAVAAGLAAQYEATLIRERRLADDRESRLLAEAEARLRQARAQADQRAAGAEAELISARAQFAELTSQLTAREASLRTEIEAYRAEALNVAARASPDRLAALQRFADGDRVGAWPVIEELTQASVRARMAAASSAAAGEIREIAGLRNIMRINGEANSAQVLELWDQAATLDPRHLDTQLKRAVLLLDMGRLAEARGAAESGLAIAANDDERANANVEIGRIAIASGDLAGAKAAFEAQLPYLRQRAAADAQGKRDLVVALNNLGDVLTRQGDPNAAYRAYHEALGLTLELSRAEPDSQLLQTDITISNDRIGDLFYAHGMYDRAGPIFQENLDFRRRFLERSPGDVDRKLLLCASLERMGDIRSQERNFPAARALFEESLAMRTALAAADPSSIAYQANVARTTNMVGDTYREEGNLGEARRRYQASLEARRRMAAADPNNALLTRDVAYSLQRLGLTEQNAGNRDAARGHFNEARTLLQGLVARDGSSGEFRQALTSTEELLRRLDAQP